MPATAAWEAEYRPFGEAITTGNLNFPLRFPGQYHDAETGLHYNWHRYYDPATGRYLTSDPIGLEGGLNPYLYAEGNPLYFTDPTGHVGIPGAIYGGLAGAVGGYVAGGWEGVIPGGLAGAVIGMFMPGGSGVAGASIGAGVASISGQAASNFIQNEDVFNRCNYSMNAVYGAAAGGYLGGLVSRSLVPYFPVIRTRVIGKPKGAKTVFKTPGNIAGALTEGVSVGVGEKVGGDL